MISYIPITDHEARNDELTLKVHEYYENLSTTLCLPSALIQKHLLQANNDLGIMALANILQ
jgi:hypothetical protein